MEINGIKHKSMWITEEEKVVIDAMRAGADVDITFYRVALEEVIKRTDELPRNLLSKRRVRDLSHHVKRPFINFYAENEDRNIRLNHFVDIEKATDGNQ